MNKLETPISQGVEAVVKTRAAEPVTFKPPLAEIGGPDTGEMLVENSTASDFEIRFTYCGHDILVDGRSRVQFD